MKHAITRMRHELRRRSLTVAAVEHLTPAMLRITLSGDDLADFTSAAPDDHVKLFVPVLGGEPARRDYTPRAFDREARRLVIDFALHDAGPATLWAMNARVGDELEIGGPRGSAVVPTDFDWWLLVGDETALPAIGRRLEELPAGTTVTSLVTVPGPQDEQSFATCADHTALWVHRPVEQADDPDPVLAALAKIALPPGDGFVWTAAEARVARAIREHILGRGHPLAWTQTRGYWVKGQADATEHFD
jgi:NADPH-dependent ferric siderophore reductase